MKVRYFTQEDAKKVIEEYRFLEPDLNNPKLNIRVHNRDENKFFVTFFDGENEILLAEYLLSRGIQFDAVKWMKSNND